MKARIVAASLILLAAAPASAEVVDRSAAGFEIRDGQVCIPGKARNLLKVDLDQTVFVSPFEYGRK